jgi:hypothetical protein
MELPRTAKQQAGVAVVVRDVTCISKGGGEYDCVATVLGTNGTGGTQTTSLSISATCDSENCIWETSAGQGPATEPPPSAAPSLPSSEPPPVANANTGTAPDEGDLRRVRAAYNQLANCANAYKVTFKGDVAVLITEFREAGDSEFRLWPDSPANDVTMKQVLETSRDQLRDCAANPPAEADSLGDALLQEAAKASGRPSPGATRFKKLVERIESALRGR